MMDRYVVNDHDDCKSPKDRVVGPLPNGLFMASKWGIANHVLTGMILQVTPVTRLFSAIYRRSNSITVSFLLDLGPILYVGSPVWYIFKKHPAVFQCFRTPATYKEHMIVFTNICVSNQSLKVWVISFVKSSSKILDFLETKSTGASTCSHRTWPPRLPTTEKKPPMTWRQLALQCSAFLDQSCLSGYLSSGNFVWVFSWHKKMQIKS